MSRHCIMILGAGGRVGMQIAAEFLRLGQDLVLLDILAQSALEQKAGRLRNDAYLATGACASQVRVYGGVDALDQARITDILAAESPDLVINYAIPITWDATKRLPNYAQISGAGLGAFTPIQVVTPLIVGRAIADAGIDAHYMVGNLPDITVPVITGIAAAGGVKQPACGAGNVGLNQVAFRRQVAQELDVDFERVGVALVSHHVHWVAPREPGYSNEAPFLARVSLDGNDISSSFDDLRALMNRGVVQHYETAAEFSSTTGILASRVARALLDDGGARHYLHAPAPNGLPGGYPLCISEGEVNLDLPDDWQPGSAVAAMEACHALDGVQSIDADGSVRFTEMAREILSEELSFTLPELMLPADIEALAREQIGALQRVFDNLRI